MPATFLTSLATLLKAKQCFLAKKPPRKSSSKGMSFGGSLDLAMDSMEETRFKKRHQALIQRLERKLHFSYLEVECLLIMYYKLQKDGQSGIHKQVEGVTKVQFRDVLHCALDMTDDSLMDRVFLALDKGPSTYISMETWATALSLFLRGTLEEKINFCFSIVPTQDFFTIAKSLRILTDFHFRGCIIVYDIMGDGILARDSIFHLLRSSMVSQSGEEDAEESARDMIEVITKKMDLDRDGKISFNDFRLSVYKNPMLLEAFGQCLPSRIAAYSFLTTFTQTPKTL